MVYMLGRIDIDNPREEDLSRYQRLQLSMYGIVYLGDIQRDGWSDALPFYAFRCETHGLVVDRPHGHYDRIDCPKCLQERIKLIKR